jgi:hypothetical protein
MVVSHWWLRGIGGHCDAAWWWHRHRQMVGESWNLGQPQVICCQVEHENVSHDSAKQWSTWFFLLSWNLLQLCHDCPHRQSLSSPLPSPLTPHLILVTVISALARFHLQVLTPLVNTPWHFGSCIVPNLSVAPYLVHDSRNHLDVFFLFHLMSNQRRTMVGMTPTPQASATMTVMMPLCDDNYE